MTALSVTSLRVDDARLHNGGMRSSSIKDVGLIVTFARWPIGIAALFELVHGYAVAAVVLYCIFAAVDYFDGSIARSQGNETSARRIADVVVDRTMIAGTLIALTTIGDIPPLLMALFIARDLAQGLISGAFALRFRTVFVAPKMHMLYGLSILMMVVCVTAFPSLALASEVAAVAIATACLADFVRKIFAIV